MSRKSPLLGIVSFLLIFVMAVVLLGSTPAPGVANPKKDDFHTGRVPKYVFLFIGDGLSYPQVSSAEMYLGNKSAPGAVLPRQLNFTQFPVHGAAMTHDSTSFVPDSASTATSIASGEKTLSGVINKDVTKTREFRPITEDLKAMGYKIGIITSVPIDHATPAAFYAKVDHRNQVDSIARQLAASGFDFFGGGGFQGNAAQREKSLGYALAAGYTFANTRADILALNNASGKVLAISPDLDGAALNYELDRDKTNGELSLADFARKGIEVLDNKNGFFMMVESGKIDWAGHANDAAANIHDTIAFADAIEEALKVYRKYPKDTLIIITGDHECGGMTIGFAGTAYDTFFEKLENVTMSYVEFTKIVNAYRQTVTKETASLSDLFPMIEQAYGLTPATLNSYEMALLEAALERTMTPASERPYSVQERLLYGGYEPLTVKLSHIVNNKAGLHFSSYSHTGLPVPVYAIGAGAELFDGFYDNTDIYFKLFEITKILRGKPAARAVR